MAATRADVSCAGSHCWAVFADADNSLNVLACVCVHGLGSTTPSLCSHACRLVFLRAALLAEAIPYEGY